MEHRVRTERCAGVGLARWLGIWVMTATLAGAVSAWAKLETWRQEGAAAFSKHHRERVVISDQGHARLGQALLPTGPLAAERVWDLARASDGTVFAATGDAGKVFRQSTKEGAAWTVALDAADTQALALAATPDGKVYVGTGPGGQVIEVTDPQHPASRPDPKVQYIWDLAADAQGNLFAATGPAGQLWKRSRDGKWSLVFDSKATHLLCVALAPDGTVYAGSDGEGLIFRINREGKVSVLYDAPQSEVRTLLLAPDGSLYAGTAAESGGGGSSRAPSLFSLRDDGQDPGERSAMAVSRTDRGEQPGRQIKGAVSPVVIVSRRQAGRAQAPGSRLRRTQADLPRRQCRLPDRYRRRDSRDLPHQGPGLCALLVRGPTARRHRPRRTALRGPRPRPESTPLAKLDNGQILSLLAKPDGEILLGTGDPGTVVRLSSGFVSQGELVSEVYDTKFLSRFGALSWRADSPAGTAVAVQARSGNVGEPDETWSAWSAEQTDPAAARAESPPGRFVQYRVKLSTRDPQRTPELSSVSLSFRSGNLPPEINRLDIPDVSTADGATRQTRLSVRWDVTDPNDDELGYTVRVRKDGWPSWISLTETPISEKTYTWDTTAFPSGYYRLRLTATDRPSNSPDDAITRDRESPSFIVDHEPPQVLVTPREKKALIVLSDNLTRVVKAEYALDGGAWTPLFPDDGLFDTLREQINVALPELKPGVHLLMVRATDAAGNVGSGDALVVVRN